MRDIGYGDHVCLPFTDDTEQRDLLTTEIICSYDTRVPPRDVVVDARRTHPELAVGTSSRPSGRYVDATAADGF